MNREEQIRAAALQAASTFMSGVIQTLEKKVAEEAYLGNVVKIAVEFEKFISTGSPGK